MIPRDRNRKSFCRPGEIGRGVVLALLTFAPLLLPALSVSSSEPVVRILVDEGIHRVVLRGRALTVEKGDSHVWRKMFTGLRGASFTGRGGKIHLEGSSFDSGRFRVVSAGGTLHYVGRNGDNLRRGSIVITSDPGGMTVVNHVPLESYLVGLVNGEIDSNWPSEAVKAQVVAARTFALYRMQEGDPLYDVRGDTGDQVYHGAGGEDERALRAVRATRGMAIFYDGKLVPAFYHSSCGGRTADAKDVWGTPHPALKSVPDADCGDAPRAVWRVVMGSREVQGILQRLYPGIGAVRRLGVHRSSPDGRVSALFFDTDEGRTLVDSGDFRSEAGYTRLPSTLFTMSGANGKVVFDGRGNGHGVGLCQWGSRGAALKGWDYRRILKKYYTGIDIKRAY